MTGHALVLTEPGRCALTELPARAPGHGDVLIAVHAAGICGSDRELWQGTRPPGFARYPITPGHEWSGTVLAAGAGVDPGLSGRRVVGEGFRNCRECARCLAGQTTLCTGGYRETGFTEPGAMATTLTLPARLVHPLQDDADLDAAALLEPAACAAAAVAAAEPAPGERAAVVGVGTLGALVIQLLAARRPGALLAVGAGDHQRERALRSGAHDYRVTPATGAGEFDVVVEAAGGRDTAALATALARRGGRVVLTGIPGPGATGLSPAELVVRNLELRTVFGAPPAAWADAVLAFTAGILDPRPLITHRLPLTEFAAAMALLAGGDPAVGKVLLHPRS